MPKYYVSLHKLIVNNCDIIAATHDIMNMKYEYIAKSLLSHFRTQVGGHNPKVHTMTGR